MNPGELREVIEIIRPSLVQDETGQRVDGWELVSSARAAKLATEGGETVASGQQTVARVPTQFRMRFPKAYEVDPRMRIVHRQKLYQVVSVLEADGRRAELVVTCEELTGEPPWQSST